MHILPQNFDCDFLLGKTLEFVTFSQNNVQFYFNANVRIAVESAFEYVRIASDEMAVLQHIPIEESKVMKCIGQTINGASLTTNGSLVLTFGNGDRITIIDDSEQFECYSVSDGEREYYA